MGWWGPPEMRCGRPRNMPLSTGYFAKCGSSTWKCTSVIIEICWKKYDPSRPACQGHSRFITGTDSDQSATYDFLLVIQSYHGQEGLHCTIFDKQRFWSKIANFSHPCIFIDSSEGVSRGIFLTLVVFKKLGSYSYQKAERIWQCEHTSQCHGWTDRRMKLPNTIMLCMLMRDNYSYHYFHNMHCYFLSLSNATNMEITAILWREVTKKLNPTVNKGRPCTVLN